MTTKITIGIVLMRFQQVFHHAIPKLRSIITRLAFLIAALSPMGLHALPIELSPVDSGKVRFFYGPYDPVEYAHEKDLTSIRHYFNGYDSGSGERGYLIYDLTAIGGNVTAAHLFFDLSISGYILPSHQFRVFNAAMDMTAQDYLNLAEGPAEQQLLTGLASGPQWGEQTVPTVVGKNVFEVDLNSLALDEMSKNGYLALGLFWARDFDLSANGPVYFDSPVTLRLDVEAATVPSPSTPFLFLVLPVLLLLRRYG